MYLALGLELLTMFQLCVNPSQPWATSRLLKYCYKMEHKIMHNVEHF